MMLSFFFFCQQYNLHFTLLAIYLVVVSLKISYSIIKSKDFVFRIKHFFSKQMGTISPLMGQWNNAFHPKST